MLNNINTRLQIFRRLMPFTYKLKKFFWLLALVNLCNMLISLATPLLFRIMVDDVMINKRIMMLIPVCAGYAGLFLIGFLLDSLSNYSSNKLLNRMSFNIRLELWRRYSRMDFAAYERYGVGDLKLRLDEDVEKLNDFAKLQTSDWVIAYLTMMVTGIALFVMNWQLALMSMAIVPITFFMGRAIGKGERALNEQRRKVNGERDNWLSSSLAGWKEVKALNLEKHEHISFVRYIHKTALIDAKWVYYWVMQALVIPIIKDKFLMKFSLYFIGGLLIMQGHFTIGTLLVFMRYFDVFCNSINKVNDRNIALQENMPSYERVFELIALELVQVGKGQSRSKLSGGIRFEQVSFQYNNDLGDVLRNINFEIKQGETIAIVGKSGAGKTTILKLLLNMISCTKGRILIDTRDISKCSPVILHRSIGVVMQDSILFNLSIRENLKLARMSATDEEIVEACELAGICNFIDALPDGYNTIIGERGVKLSGGQRQRLAIARVFLQQPEMIVLDEATSALDQESEALIHDSIQKLSRSKTVLIIAHRLSSVLIANRVLVLESGKIAGMAHHLDLLGHCAAYDELFAEQHLSYLSERGGAIWNKP
ncbi:ABC transporter ATP-binding protein [Paenibacillus mesotrionivorans]|uniref:ABC transporter ATP-binding protein n=1 Tax=Paenibacillus mesotrionivorans TaxID=3160968 RepID=A0ACC7NSV2_9BACL